MIIETAVQPALFPGKTVPAAGADDLACKRVSRIQQRSSALCFCLHPGISSPVQYRLVCIRDIVLWELAIVFHFVLCDRVRDIALLPAQVSGIDLVIDQLSERALLKEKAFCCAVSGCVQIVTDGLQRFAFQIKLKHPADDNGFFRDDRVATLFFIITVTQDMLVRHTNVSGLKALPNAPLAVFGDTAAFFLGKGSQDREHEFTVAAHRIDVFLFKPDFDSQFL